MREKSQLPPSSGSWCELENLLILQCQLWLSFVVGGHPPFISNSWTPFEVRSTPILSLSFDSSFQVGYLTHIWVPTPAQHLRLGNTPILQPHSWLPFENVPRHQFPGCLTRWESSQRIWPYTLVSTLHSASIFLSHTQGQPIRLPGLILFSLSFLFAPCFIIISFTSPKEQDCPGLYSMTQSPERGCCSKFSGWVSTLLSLCWF